MRRRDGNTYRIAFCSMMAALGTAIMLTGGLIPVFTYCSPIIAAVLLAVVKDEEGSGSAWLVWAVTGTLSLMMGIDKEAAFFYVFLAWYPILKQRFDAIGSRALRFIAKLAVFSAAVAAMYSLTCYVLGIDEIINSFSASRWINIGFLAGMVLCMLLYDKALNGIICMYRVKIRPRLKFLNHRK